MKRSAAWTRPTRGSVRTRLKRPTGAAWGSWFASERQRWVALVKRRPQTTIATLPDLDSPTGPTFAHSAKATANDVETFFFAHANSSVGLFRSGTAVCKKYKRIQHCRIFFLSLFFFLIRSSRIGKTSMEVIDKQNGGDCRRNGGDGVRRKQFR